MPRVIFRHESFQLWDSQVNGILLKKHNDFITLSLDGISVCALGSNLSRMLYSSSN